MILNDRSEKNLKGVHPDLLKVVRRAAEIYDGPGYFVAIEGLRSLERQKELVKQGASKTMNSRHLTGHAVDLAPWVDSNGDGKAELSWHGKHFIPIEKAMKQAAKELGVPVEWGGDWKGGWDRPHWQLPWKKYPSRNNSEKARMVQLGDPIEEETSTEDKTKKTVAVAAAGGIGSAPGIEDAVGLLSNAPTNPTNIVSMVIAAILVGLAVYTIYKIWKK